VPREEWAAGTARKFRPTVPSNLGYNLARPGAGPNSATEYYLCDTAGVEEVDVDDAGAECDAAGADEDGAEWLAAGAG